LDILKFGNLNSVSYDTLKVKEFTVTGLGSQWVNLPTGTTLVAGSTYTGAFSHTNSLGVFKQELVFSTDSDFTNPDMSKLFIRSAANFASAASLGWEEHVTRDDLNTTVDSVVDTNNGEFFMAPSPENGNLSLYRIENEIVEFVGEVGGGYTDQLVYTKALGGLRFKDEASGFEYFVNRRDVSGQALGAVFGNLDSPDGNYLATSEEGGFNVCQKTDVDITQDIGNAASNNYIDSSIFTFVMTSDQVRPYGAQVLSFVGETDVDFSDIGFDVRILDSTGTYVYSDIQSKAVFDSDPSASPFRLSSTAGVVTMPISQPFPMDSDTSYTIEYIFASPIRLKGDGGQPALTVNAKRLEYYATNYQAVTEINTSNFIAESGRNYKVDTSGGTVTASVHPTVKSLFIGDYELTWSNSNPFILDFGALGTLQFGTAQKGKKLEVIQHGATYRVYDSNGAFISSLP
jgi:hypothetical protein